MKLPKIKIYNEITLTIPTILALSGIFMMFLTPLFHGFFVGSIVLLFAAAASWMGIND